MSRDIPLARRGGPGGVTGVLEGTAGIMNAHLRAIAEIQPSSGSGY